MFDESQIERLFKYIEFSKNIIPINELKYIEHYYEHAEYEMSYECLVLGYMNISIYPDEFNFSEWKELAVDFDLDTHTVFKSDFWSKFLSWGESY